ncbi:MAG: hypothetical protein JRG74_14300 [Deltaproteobacteria bacterium]|nr:hypothetical protein [Deltaproteobacteria bacterium]MBW2167204.1 hypothetical protein [Deltaproteobacteria bacterium]
MSSSTIKYNTNVVDTDFINLDTIKLDLNSLEVAKVVLNGASAHGILFMKNGHSHVVDISVINNLDAYCR